MFTFEKNVPVPTHANPLGIDNWKIGDSFTVSDAKLMERVRTRAHRLGFKVAFRKTPPTGWRCWRTA